MDPDAHRSTTRAMNSASATRFAVDVRGTAHAAGPAPELDHLQLGTELVTRDHRPAELHVIDRHEVDDLVLRVVERAHQEHPAHLGHRFDDQHAGHDRMPGKMTLEEGLVDRHVLEPDHALVAVHFHDPVDQEERIAVGHDLQDLADVERHAPPPARARNGPGEAHVAPMARPVRDDVATDPAAGQGQVSHDVPRFVAHELIVPPERGVNDRGSVRATADAVEAPRRSPWARRASTSRVNPKVRAGASSRRKSTGLMS